MIQETKELKLKKLNTGVELTKMAKLKKVAGCVMLPNTFWNWVSSKIIQLVSIKLRNFHSRYLILAEYSRVEVEMTQIWSS